jgi:hypothetical protein
MTMNGIATVAQYKASAPMNTKSGASESTANLTNLLALPSANEARYWHQPYNA